MNKTNVTSRNQKGGITAKEVHIGDKTETISVNSSKGLPKWVRWLVAIAVILGAVFTALLFLRQRNEEMSGKKIIEVTSHNQQGGITAYQINIQPGDRILDDRLASQLQSHIDKQQFNEIFVKAVMGDQEAIRYASQIKNYLSSEGYLVRGIGQFISSEPIQGQRIKPASEDGVLEIVIGSR